MPQLKKGSSGEEVFRFYDYFVKWSSSYAFLLGARDGYFGSNEAEFVDELQRRLGIPRTGIFGDLEASRTGYRWTGNATPPAVKPRRKIWYYSYPGSGADFNVGPAFETGVHCERVLNINHQPVKFGKGGYLGLLGGDSKLSYIEVTYDLYKSTLWLLQNNPDVTEALRVRGVAEDGTAAKPLAPVDVELEFGAYSQSEDGVEDALEIIFGDGGFVIPLTGEVAPPGPYRALRDRINFVHAFGNPSKFRTGIARKTRPKWLLDKIFNITTKGDFYAEVPINEKIRPAFYAIIIRAETEMPFGVRVIKIALPVIMSWASTILPFLLPLVGGFGPAVQFGMGAISGLQGLTNNSLIGGLMSQANADIEKEIDQEVIDLLVPLGLMKNIPALIGLVGSLTGLQAHGEYHLPKPEFNGRTGIQVAIDHVNNYRRP